MKFLKLRNKGVNSVVKSIQKPEEISRDFVKYDTNCPSEDSTTSRQILALQNTRNHFNKYIFEKVFDRTLGPVMLRPAKHGKALGYYRKASWKEDGIKAVPEISLCPVGLRRADEKIYATFLHELCHQFQDQYGNPGRGGYHNLEFAKIMKSVGLICSNTGEPGGKQTGDQMTHFIDPDGLFIKVFKEMPKEYLLPFKPLFDIDDSDVQRLAAPSIIPEPVPNIKNKTKYTCLGCGAAVWGKPKLDFSCNPCKQNMVVIEEFGKK